MILSEWGLSDEALVFRLQIYGYSLERKATLRKNFSNILSFMTL